MEQQGIILIKDPVLAPHIQKHYPKWAVLISDIAERDIQFFEKP